MIKIKEGFKNERVVSVSEKLLEEYRKDPLVRNLYIRKIGYFPQARFHFIQKADGCDYAMLIYCIDGKGWYEINGQTYILRKNEFVILPSDTPYTFGASSRNPWSIYWLHFQGTQAHRFLPSGYAPQPLQPGDDSRIQDRLRLFDEIFHNFSMNYRKEYMLYSCLCLYQFLGSFTFLKPYRNITSTMGSPSFAHRVIRFMHENVQNNLTLSQLAAQFKYSPSHFSDMFRQEIGGSPIHYFIQLKMQKACQLLEFSELKINEISQSLGFEDPAYFSRTFSKIIGIPPSLYRTQKNQRRQLHIVP